MVWHGAVSDAALYFHCIRNFCVSLSVEQLLMRVMDCIPRSLLTVSVLLATLFFASMLPLADSKAQIISTSTCCQSMDWSEFDECKKICRAYVHYPTIQSCVVNETCTYVVKDWLKLQAVLKAKKQTLSVPCDMSAKRALCAYHFPRCMDDQRIFGHMVCHSTCQDMLDDCSFELNAVTSRPKCSDRNIDCSNPSVLLKPLNISLLMSFILALALA